MKKCWLLVVGLGFLAIQAHAQDASSLDTHTDKVSYAIGVAMAKNLKRQGIEINQGNLIKGLKDGMSGTTLLMSPNEISTLLTGAQAEIRQRELQALDRVSAENKEKGDAFREENKSKEGVFTLADGLQYKVLRAGDGNKPEEGDTVKCQYRGTLTDGTVFDSSYKLGKPVELKVSEVIPGWQEALKLMPVGSEWQLVIPPELAYGRRSAGRIGPDSTLIFDVELVSIVAKP
jgi:FKBP-type peptidyl-prolyl cis-trans isomerase